MSSSGRDSFASEVAEASRFIRRHMKRPADLSKTGRRVVRKVRVGAIGDSGSGTAQASPIRLVREKAISSSSARAVSEAYRVSDLLGNVGEEENQRSGSPEVGAVQSPPPVSRLPQDLVRPPSSGVVLEDRAIPPETQASLRAISAALCHSSPSRGSSPVLPAGEGPPLAPSASMVANYVQSLLPVGQTVSEGGEPSSAAAFLSPGTLPVPLAAPVPLPPVPIFAPSPVETPASVPLLAPPAVPAPASETTPVLTSVLASASVPLANLSSVSVPPPSIIPASTADPASALMSSPSMTPASTADPASALASVPLPLMTPASTADPASALASVPLPLMTSTSSADPASALASVPNLLVTPVSASVPASSATLVPAPGPTPAGTLAPTTESLPVVTPAPVSLLTPLVPASNGPPLPSGGFDEGGLVRRVTPRPPAIDAASFRAGGLFILEALLRTGFISPDSPEHRSILSFLLEVLNH